MDGQDDLNPTDEPNPALDESLGQGKARPNFFTTADGLAPKLCHLGRHMGWVSVQAGH